MQQDKEELVRAIQKQKNAAAKGQFNNIVARYDDLLQEIEQNEYVAVVVGEFNHGKSTFVNALLGESLLPMGITPTTALLHKIKYGALKQITVYHMNGEKEKLDWSTNALAQFIAKKQADIEPIDFIQIEAPIELLKNQVLLDTPGLNDVNELRADITYNYMPKADVIFFMLSVQMALRKSELDFIKEQISLGGIQFVFIVNMIDQVEAEELSDVLENVRARLRNIIEEEPIIIEVSALDALEGAELQDYEQYEDSNIEAVKQEMYGIFAGGRRTEQRITRYQLRAEQIDDLLTKQIELKNYAISQSRDKLLQDRKEVNNLQQQLPAFQMQLADYLKQCENEYIHLIEDSVELLFTTIEQKIIEDMQRLHGSTIEHYLKQTLPIFIKQQVASWSYKNTPMLHTIINKLSTEIASGLSTQFNKEMYLPFSFKPLVVEEAFQPMQIYDMNFKKADATIRSGLLAGGAGALLVAAGASVLMPIVAFAGMPLLKKYLEKNDSEQMRQSVMEQLKKELFKMKTAFLQTVYNYVDEMLLQLQQQTIATVNAQWEELVQLIEVQLQDNAEQQNEQKLLQEDVE